jgi:hypothetical protein
MTGAQAELTAVAAPREEGSLLWVDPLKINLVYGREDVRDIARCAGEVRDGDWDRPARKPFTDEAVFRALVEFLVLGRPWDTTKFFARVSAEIESGRTKFGCTTVDEFRRRGADVRRLYHAIREHGYRSQGELGSRRAHDEVRVAIGRDGRFLFVDGRHRLAIARLLGVRRVPVQVTLRHAGWEAFREQVRAYAGQREGRVYQVIDHPDLASVPAHHDTERVDLIERALAGYRAGGRRLLDIGTHWGYMARRMEPLGFACTGVELNKRNARFAERLTVATESSMRVWQGDVFDFEGLEDQHVVLALNVFHHLVKTQESHDRLAHMLGRLRSAEVIVFEAHKSGDAQLRDAYRNYPADEFAAFVARHAGMSTVAPIGHAADGRPLFRISR